MKRQLWADERIAVGYDMPDKMTVTHWTVLTSAPDVGASGESKLRKDIKLIKQKMLTHHNNKALYMHCYSLASTVI